MAGDNTVTGARQIPNTPVTTQNGSEGEPVNNSSEIGAAVIKRFFAFPGTVNGLNCEIDRYQADLGSSDPMVRQKAMKALQNWVEDRGVSQLFSKSIVETAIANLDKRSALAPDSEVNRNHDAYCALDDGDQLSIRPFPKHPPLHWLGVKPLNDSGGVLIQKQRSHIGGDGDD